MQIDIVMLPVNSIIPYWRNPRRNDKTVDALVAVIEKRGFNVPIVVDKNHVVVKGHARLRAAKRLGMEKVPCIISDASDDVIKADRIADNKIQELSMWDFGKLNMELERLGDKMEFGRLFHPDDGLSHDDVEVVPEAQFKPVGLQYWDGDFDGNTEVSSTSAAYPVVNGSPELPETGHFQPSGQVSGGNSQTPAAGPVKRKLKTLCPYCGKVVILDV